MGAFLICRQWGTVLAALREDCPQISYPPGLLLLSEGSHDGAGDAVVVVVVFGNGVGETLAQVLA